MNESMKLWTSNQNEMIEKITQLVRASSVEAPSQLLQTSLPHSPQQHSALPSVSSSFPSSFPQQSVFANMSSTNQLPVPTTNVQPVTSYTALFQPEGIQSQMSPLHVATNLQSNMLNDPPLPLGTSAASCSYIRPETSSQYGSLASDDSFSDFLSYITSDEYVVCSTDTHHSESNPPSSEFIQLNAYLCTLPPEVRDKIEEVLAIPPT